MRHWIVALTLGAGLLGAGGVAGRDGPSDATTDSQPRPRSEAAKARYPQPVLVGNLIGRQVLENVPQQHVLGRVAGVACSDDKVSVFVETGGLLGFGTRQVAVPVETMALLGSFLVAMELNSGKLAVLSDAPVAPGAMLSANATIRVGLARN